MGVANTECLNVTAGGVYSNICTSNIHNLVAWNLCTPALKGVKRALMWNRRGSMKCLFNRTSPDRGLGDAGVADAVRVVQAVVG